MNIPKVIDLRSDTVTRPTPAMRQAMATCEVGDDVFGDDPTVIELENIAAKMTGKQASLWCPTGTMANQVAICAHTHPGQQVIAGDWSHIVNYELGGVAWNSLCQLHIVSDDGGYINPHDMKKAVRTEDLHTPGTGLVCLENTHNRRGGRIMPIEVLEQNARIAHERNIPVHLDGARIWNASTASGIPVTEYASHVDSLMFCLSKGLGSPAGSMLCGDEGFIEKSRRIRKRFGGGLRQAGVLASCGLISLSEMIHRLSDDHVNAAKLARAFNDSGLLNIDPVTVETNICIFTLPDNCRSTAFHFTQVAKEHGLLVTYMGDNLIRMVTHYDFNPELIPEVISRTETIMAKM